jgi:TDG/mug DNA glycosylase family protein
MERATWANLCYQHLPRARLPLALAHLHWSLAPGSPVELALHLGTEETTDRPGDEFPGRFFAGWQPESLTDVVTGAGFTIDDVTVSEDVVSHVEVRARRARSLPDTVGPGMRMLVCGLNPSVYAADAGIGYARPTNRFWDAAVAAGVLSRRRDPLHALVHHRVGMTDLVKRPTSRSAEVTADEYRAGADRVQRLVRWLRPEVVCFVGLEGWRAAVDRNAVPGLQLHRFGGVPAYVMPSTSGLNAHATPAQLVEHLRAAAAVARS